MIARYAFRKNCQPRMVALVPELQAPPQAARLVMQYLPFLEDVRDWTSASLPEANTEQRAAVGALIDAMSLEASGKEELRLEETCNPALARFYQNLTRKAVLGTCASKGANEDAEKSGSAAVASIPPPAPELASILEPPEAVAKRVEQAGLSERLLKAFGGLEKVEKTTGRGRGQKRFWREAVAEKRKDTAWGLADVDTKKIKVDAVAKKMEKEEEDEQKIPVKEEDSQGLDSGMAAPVGLPPKVHIGSVHPERDFERWLAQRKGGVDFVGPAIEQMRDMIIRLTEEGEEFLGKALSCLGTLRRGCVNEGEATAYNDFLRQIRGGSKRLTLLWDRAKESSLGLITDSEVPTSSTTAEEAQAFLRGDDVATKLTAATESAVTTAQAALSERDLEDMLE